MTHHPIITQVSIGKRDILYKWLAEYSHILIVSDTNTATFAEQIIDELDNTQVLILSSDSAANLVPDETAIGKIFIAAGQLQANSAVLAVGSGTICDLVRYVSSRLGLPYHVAATAASMDGYTSSVTALIVGNLKTTYPAKPPAGVLADPDIFINAPPELSSAGFGDIMGKFTSVSDWEMEGLVSNDSGFCPDLASEMRIIAEKCLNEQTPSATMEALLNSGLVMQKAGHSKIASGAEHHLSHYWEMMALMEGALPALHGAKVGVATLAVLQAQEWLLLEDISSQTWVHAKELASGFNLPAWQDEIRSNYYNASDQILAQWQDECSNTRLALLMRIQDNWPCLKTILSKNAVTLPQIKSALVQMNCITTPASLGITKEVFITGVLHAFRVRRRFTTWRLLDIMGLLPLYAERLADMFEFI